MLLNKLKYIKNLEINLKYALKRNEMLSKELKHLCKINESCTCKLSLYEAMLKSDKDVQFYTGISSIPLFNKLHKYVAPYVRRKLREPRLTVIKLKRYFSKTPKKMGPSTTLQEKMNFF